MISTPQEFESCADIDSEGQRMRIRIRFARISISNTKDLLENPSEKWAKVRCTTTSPKIMIGRIFMFGISVFSISRR